jgi:hypothetical protein
MLYFDRSWTDSDVTTTPVHRFEGDTMTLGISLSHTVDARKSRIIVQRVDEW